MILLDTHVFVWWATDDTALGAAGRAVIANTADIYVSTVSFWEISIKATKKGSEWTAATAPDLYSSMSDLGFHELTLKVSDAFAVATLENPGPRVHKDPFDRLMLAQARLRGFDLVTSDALLSQYGSNVVMV